MKRLICFCILLLSSFLLGLTGCSTPQNNFYKDYPGYDGELNQHMRIIDAPPEVIFDLLTDPQQFTALAPKYTIVTFDTPPPYQVGTRLKIKIDHLLKFTWHTQVREMVPNKMTRLEFLDGLFKGGTEIWELEFKEGYTRVIQTIIVAPQDFFGSFIWNFKARTRHNKMAEKFLDNLKAKAESVETSWQRQAGVF
jgi:ligand-binding SRPBCC domain-containing protein